MYRGTTPTLTFVLPFEASKVSTMNIAFAQAGTVVFEKALSDCTTSGKTVSVTLSQENTLALDAAKETVDIQLRVVVDGAAMASRVIVTSVEAILKDGEIV